MSRLSEKASDATRNAILIADSAWAVLSEQHPDWSIDMLLLHPKAGIAVCRIVRRQLHDFSLTDHRILAALLNGRKRGWIDPKGLRKRRSQ